MKARIRQDKLLIGELRFESLVLSEPTLNLVKRPDGSWNVIGLIDRLSTPRRMPLNFVPAFEVNDARIDFKFGTRKSTLYLLGTDLKIYPARSGKLNIDFAGWPARTDRAGNGFGHLRGNANWFADAASHGGKQLEADLTLDPSNVSELATLFEGHDLGVHGTLESHAHIEGPAAALTISGDLRLYDVRRWDLLVPAEQELRLRYGGSLDWTRRELRLSTIAVSAGQDHVALELAVKNLLLNPQWTISAHLNQLPVPEALPIARRLGVGVPNELKLDGAMDGDIAYASGLGFKGAIAIHDLLAAASNLQQLRSPILNAKIDGTAVHFSPATFDAAGGILQVSGDYDFATMDGTASLAVNEFPSDVLSGFATSTFGSTPALAYLKGGVVTGSFRGLHRSPEPTSWSGDFDFSNAVLAIPALATALTGAAGHVALDQTSFDLQRFSARLGQTPVAGSYRYNAALRRQERLHVNVPALDLVGMERVLDPVLRPQDLLARLRVTKRTLPRWLAERNAEGDLTVDRFSVNETLLGRLLSRFVWQGPNVQLTSVEINMPEGGSLKGHGTVSLAAYNPRYRFQATATGFAWRGGKLDASGTFDSVGTGSDLLRNLHAQGTFAGEEIALSADDEFDSVAGEFVFSFADNWPDLRLTRIQASNGDDAWTGDATSQRDGKLVFELESSGRQRRVISSLLPATPAAVSYIENAPKAGPIARIR